MGKTEREDTVPALRCLVALLQYMQAAFMLKETNALMEC